MSAMAGKTTLFVELIKSSKEYGMLVKSQERKEAFIKQFKLPKRCHSQILIMGEKK